MSGEKDLLVLVADKSIEMTIDTLLNKRKKAIGIREIIFEIKRHPQHDSGVFRHGLELISTLKKQYEKFLLIFDYKGCGAQEDPSAIRNRLLENGKRYGFSDNDLEIIIINPELETWIWKSYTKLAGLVGKSKRDIEQFLRDVLKNDQGKPAEPQEAFEKLLSKFGKQKSASNFSWLAEKIGLRGCQDQSFQQLLECLRKWFSNGNLKNN